jgi:hypothetical protein
VRVLSTAVAVSRLKIDEVSTQKEGVAVFYLLTPHNAFMTTDIGDKGLKNWAGAWFSSKVLIGEKIKNTGFKSLEKSIPNQIQTSKYDTQIFFLIYSVK